MLTSELAYIIWMSYEKIMMIDTSTTHEFFFSLKTVHKELSNEELDVKH